MTYDLWIIQKSKQQNQISNHLAIHLLMNNQASNNFTNLESKSKANPESEMYKTAFGREKLWKDSEISFNYTSPILHFSKEKRFQAQSIYWPEYLEANSDQHFNKKRKSIVSEIATKVSKNIDEEEKNQARMSKLKTIRNSSQTVKQYKKQFEKNKQKQILYKISVENEAILERLLRVNERRKQSILRDRHGNRCNLYLDQEDIINTSNLKQIEEIGKLSKTTTGFKTSRKVKLELPHNYYPGPGTYAIKRYLESQEIHNKKRPNTQRMVRK